MSESLLGFKECRDLYATDIVGFAYDILRIEYLTNQQEDFLRDLSKFIYVNMYQQMVEEYTSTLMNPRLETSKQLQITVTD